MRQSKTKIKSAVGLKKLLTSLRTKKKIVFTNGCFDILHEGHVTYLERARLKGDILVVALDTDAAVRFQKGPSRPINALKQRMRVIASLECVDYVTSFSGSDPRPIILQLKPHVLVKGGDWKPHQILGSEEVLKWNGKVFSIPYIKGRSTTGIVKTIVKTIAKSRVDKQKNLP